MAGPAGLRVYFDLMSQPARAVFIFLKVNQIPFTPQPIALRKGEHLTAEYAKINPFQLVPAIDDNGFKLSESVAILKYLSVKYKLVEPWYPADLQRRARVDAFMAWQHLNLRMFGSMVFRTQLIEPRMNNAPVDTRKLKRFKEDLDTTLDKIETTFLAENNYLSGNDITIADLLGICELMQPMAVGHDAFKNRPKLEGWTKRVEERLKPHFEEAHTPINNVKKMFSAKI